MAENTKIGWTHGPNGEIGHTHNEVRGCAHAMLPDGTPHSGCSNCYAEIGYGTRYGITWGPPYLGGTREVAAESTRWKLVTRSRRAALLGAFERVFMFSLGDVLEEVFIPPSEDWEGWPVDMHAQDRFVNIEHAKLVAEELDEALARLWDFIRATVLVCGACGGSRLFHEASLRIGAKACDGSRPKCRGAKVGGLVPLLLTKRPRRAHLVPEDVRPFCALGGSVSDQPSADVIIEAVAAARGFALKFLSLEPMVAPVDLSRWFERIDHCGSCGAENPPQMPDRCPECGKTGTLISTWGVEEAERYRTGERYTTTQGQRDVDGESLACNWVIIGGESGRGDKPRPFHIDHARAVLAQCRAAGLPTFIKQMGEVPVISAAEWETMGEKDGVLMRTPMLKAKRRDSAPPGTVPLLFTGTGTNPEEWAHLFDVPAPELQQVPLIRTPATEAAR